MTLEDFIEEADYDIIVIYQGHVIKPRQHDMQRPVIGSWVLTATTMAVEIN